MTNANIEFAKSTYLLHTWAEILDFFTLTGIIMREIKFAQPLVGVDEADELKNVINSGVFVHGSYTSSFEESFRKQTDASASISVANCTAGLHMAHHYFSKGKKGEIICPAQTHVATAHAIELSGLTPVFVDCELETGNINTDLIADKITESTIGISVVHFNGIPANLGKLKEICSEYDLYLIEDCAIALGAKYNGVHVGNHGDAGCFSFHPVKQLTTGEGGMIITSKSHKSEFEYLRAFGVDRNFNQRKRGGQYDVIRLGFNYRMAELPAAIGFIQLDKLTDFQNRRKENYRTLENRIREINELKILGIDHKDYERSYYSMIVTVDSKKIRNEIQSTLKENGVGTSVYYPHPVPRLQYYKQKYGYSAAEFNCSEVISDKSVCLPVGPHLDSRDMLHIANTLKEALIR